MRDRGRIASFRLAATHRVFSLHQGCFRAFAHCRNHSRLLSAGRSAAGPSAPPEFASPALDIKEKKFRYGNVQHPCNLLDGFEGRGIHPALDETQESDRDANPLGKSLLSDVAGKPKAAEPPSELGSQVGHPKAQPVSNNVVAYNSKPDLLLRSDRKHWII
jgi:hypothetical protein